jgi:voltage-gated potassium channel
MRVCAVALLTGIVATGFSNQVSMRRNKLEAEITSASSDRVISSAERNKIEDLRQRLNISKQDALVIMSYLSREVRASQRRKEDS